MNKNTLIIIVLIILIIGGWFFYDSSINKVVFNPEMTLSSVSQNIVGKWQSLEDEKFIRELRADTTASDFYDGQIMTNDNWKLFTKENPVEVSFPIEEKTVYLQIIPTDDPTPLNFKVTKLTDEDLELVYMDRGGVLIFKRIQ